MSRKRPKELAQQPPFDGGLPMPLATGPRGTRRKGGKGASMLMAALLGTSEPLAATPPRPPPNSTLIGTVRWVWQLV